MLYYKNKSFYLMGKLKWKKLSQLVIMKKILKE